MKKTLLSLLTLFCVGLSSAQSDIIAVSGSQKKAIDFKDFRFINLKNNSETIIADKNAAIPEQVVGMTYDAKNQKLIFVGMHSPDIFSYDLSAGNFERLYAAGRAYSRCDLKEQFSRMATSSNGNSYALSNSSNQLIEVKPTSSGYAVRELGGLNSDFNLDQYKYYGGDLIANDNGDLFLISAHKHVVKINPTTLSATYVGEIKGIEKEFTTNGSAVLSDGNVLLSNAKGLGYYTLNFSTLNAERLDSKSETAVYDLASPYLLRSAALSSVKLNALSVYPSKITQREVQISVKTPLTGTGVVSIYDIGGNIGLRSTMNLNEVNVHTIKLDQLKPGNYYVKVVDMTGEELINEKIIVLR